MSSLGLNTNNPNIIVKNTFIRNIALLFIKCFFEILFYSLPYLVGEAEDVIQCECQTRWRFLLLYESVCNHVAKIRIFFDMAMGARDFFISGSEIVLMLADWATYKDGKLELFTINVK